MRVRERIQPGPVLFEPHGCGATAGLDPLRCPNSRCNVWKEPLQQVLSGTVATIQTETITTILAVLQRLPMSTINRAPFCGFLTHRIRRILFFFSPLSCSDFKEKFGTRLGLKEVQEIQQILKYRIFVWICIFLRNKFFSLLSFSTMNNLPNLRQIFSLKFVFVQLHWIPCEGID